jgi:hypothetical protein
MPVYVISCPDCGHVARTLVLDGCQMPSEWACGGCNGLRARANRESIETHPWEEQHGSGCLCCGAASGAKPTCSVIDG